MVTFGGYALRNVRMWQVQDLRIVHDRLIPNASVGYRGDETAGGRTIRVAGEIRNDPDYALRIEELRIRQDDVARALDLEDDSAAVNAKLGSVEVTWMVEDGVGRPSYSVTFYETS